MIEEFFFVKLHNSAVIFFVCNKKFREIRILKTPSTRSSITPINYFTFLFPLVSVCAQQHVRTWSVTRFRGMISTFPGSTVLASFNLVDLERFQSFSPSASMASSSFSEESEEKAGNLNEMTFKPKLRTTGGFPTVDSQDMMIEESLFIQRMAPNGNNSIVKKYCVKKFFFNFFVCSKNSVKLHNKNTKF